jgi:hypothetical protein
VAGPVLGNDGEATEQPLPNRLFSLWQPLLAHSSDCEQRFRFKANAVPVETEQMPVGSTCGRCSVVKWPSWRPGHLTGYDIFARLFL